MKRQEKMITKKLGRPATGKGKLIGVRLQPSELDLVDSVIAEQADSKFVLSRPQVIRMMIYEFCKDRGYIQQKAGGSKGEK